MRQLWAVFTLVFGLMAAGTALGESVDEAQALVKQTTQAVLQRLEQQKAAIEKDPNKLYGLIQDIVLPHFDFQAMSSIVLARYWRTATPAQREAFTSQFRDLLVRTYGTALLNYTGQEIRYKPVRAEANARKVEVPTEVVQSGGPPIPIVYSLYKKDGQWLVYNITVDGVSLLLNYRNEYTRKVAQSGLDALIQEMKAHNSAKGQGA